MTYERELRAVHEWLDETDAVALKHFAIDVATESKPDGTPVTVADREIEASLRRAIDQVFPGDAVVGEEHGSTGDAARRWIIDPIDGTKNYARGVPIFGTLIALEADGALVLGVASAPALRSRWWATRGGGAFRDGARIAVSTTTSLAHADISTGGLQYIPEQRRGAWWKIVESVRRTRAFGDYWGHMLVAQGSIEAMLEVAPLHVWDVAAPKLIVEEAGGRATDLLGDEGLHEGPLVTSNGALHDQLLAMLNG